MISLKHTAILALALAAVGCGSDDEEPGSPSIGGSGGSADSGAGGSASVGPLRYTDPLTTGGTGVPVRHRCAQTLSGSVGDNISPPLTWSGVPAEALSLAIVVEDIRFGFFHWTIWDIPPDAGGLPEGIPPGYDITDPAGAHQVSLTGTNEYFGPCSDPGPAAGTYAFALHALDVAELPVDASAAWSDVVAAIEAASIESVVWEGTPE